jgi:hypothetical protein
MLVWAPRDISLSSVPLWLLSTPVELLAESKGVFELAVNEKRETALIVTK